MGESGVDTRVHALDGLRGLAALSVVVAKYWADLPASWHRAAPWDWAVYPPLTFLLNDRGAVVLFFCLSGYVLALSLSRGGAPIVPQFVPFLVRRVCRIWVPYAVVLGISGAIWVWLHRVGWAEPAELAPWYWGDTPQFLAFWRQLVLQYTIPPLNPPGWSLVAEMLISAAFPVFLMAVRRWPVSACLLALGATLAGEPGDVRAFRFVLYFMLGAVLALHRGAVLARVRPVLARRGWVTVLASLFVLGLAPVHWYSELLMGLGALALMILAMQPGGVARFLVRGWVQALGRVSYSLYLTNTIVVHLLGAVLVPAVPMIWVLVLCVPAIWAVAWATYVALERPTTRLGARLAAAMRPAVAAMPAA